MTLLHHKYYFAVTANMSCSMSAGTKFKRLIPDEGIASQNPAQVKRVIFCTGKVYYELARERKQQKMEKDVAIIRLEQVFNQSPLSLHFLEMRVMQFCHFFIYLFFGFPPRSPHSRLIWSERRQRNMPTLSWSGVRRSTRTWATMITSGHVSSRWWPTRNPFGKCFGSLATQFVLNVLRKSAERFELLS